MIGFYNYTVWLTYLSLISGMAIARKKVLQKEKESLMGSRSLRDSCRISDT